MVFQNTRLYIVMKLAEIISSGIYHSILKTIGGRNLPPKLTIKTFLMF